MKYRKWNSQGKLKIVLEGLNAQKAGLKIIEMPVEWHYADTSTFNIKRELRCLKAIINLKGKLRDMKCRRIFLGVWCSVN